jgi:uncharacterized protein
LHQFERKLLHADDAMRYIDAFNHFFPRRFYDLLLSSPAGQKDLGKRMQGIPALYDIEERVRVVDSFPDYTQVICLGIPSIDRLVGPQEAPEWARIGNDGLAEIVTRYPDHFAGYAASLPLNAPGAAVPRRSECLPMALTQSNCTPTWTAPPSIRKHFS